MSLRSDYQDYLKESGSDIHGNETVTDPTRLSDEELKRQLLDKIKDQIQRHDLDVKARQIEAAARPPDYTPTGDLADVLEDHTTDWNLDRAADARTKWLEEATRITKDTPRDELERLLAREPDRAPSDPEALEKMKEQWTREWQRVSPKADPNDPDAPLSDRDLETDIDRLLGGGNKAQPPGPDDRPLLPEGADAAPGAPEVEIPTGGTGDGPPAGTPGEGASGGGQRTWERGTDTLKPGEEPKPTDTVKPGQPPPVSDTIPPADPPPPPPPGGPTVPPGQPPPAPDQSAVTDPNIQIPPPPPPASGPSLPNVPLAPLAPVIVAGGVEVAKAGGRGIIGKVIGGIIVILVLVGGAKVIIDNTSSGTTGPGRDTRTVGGGPFSGQYSVAERDRNATCPDGTSFRSALAQGQAGPNYNYFLRVVSDATHVSFGPDGGETILTADLSADGTFSGASPVGSQFPVSGRFQGGSGPGGTFTMEWTVPYGAGTCTTDIFAQWVSA